MTRMSCRPLTLIPVILTKIAYQMLVKARLRNMGYVHKDMFFLSEVRSFGLRWLDMGVLGK